MAKTAKLLSITKSQLDDLDNKANPDDKDIITVNRAKRQIERTEQYLTANYDIQYNIVKNEIEIKKKNTAQFLELNENDLWREFQHEKIPFSKNKTVDLLKSSFVQPFDPFKYYFETLPKWDGKTNHIMNLADHVILQDEKMQPHFYMHLRKHLIRTVKCAMVDGYFNKQAFILVHDEQNSGKTSFCRFLCPSQLNDYYTENITFDKDGLIALTENFIINLDELAALSKADINSLKSIISKVNVKIRRPYDKKATTSPRRCSFVGSTNEREFLTDSTGNVRWICFEIKKINWEYSKIINIDKVYAQAFALMKKGEQSELTREEIDFNENMNDNFRKISMEEELLGKTYNPASKNNVNATFMTPTMIINELQKQVDNSVKLTVQSLGRALTKLKYKKESVLLPGNSFAVKGYYLRKIDPLENQTF